MRPRAVLCGSYHRQPDQLRRLFRELEATGCRVLSPFSLDFTSLDAPFVTTRTDIAVSHHDAQAFHLRALRDVDFILLHAPDGYVGTSAAYELGFAHAIGKPVFSFQTPTDQMLSTQVVVVRSVFEILDHLQLSPV